MHQFYLVLLFYFYNKFYIMNILNINNIILEKIKIYKSYTKDLLLFSLPIMLGHLSHILMGTIDTLVAARHNLYTISVVSIANSIFFTIYSSLM